MSFINWGDETPEQKAARARYEEEQMLFEQAVRFARATGAMAGVGSGAAPEQPTIVASFIPYINNGQRYIQFAFYNSSNEEFELTIDWGDDIKETYKVTNDWIYPERYFPDDSERFVTFKSKDFDMNTEVGFAYTNLTSIIGLNLLSSVTSLDISGCWMTEFGEDFTWPPALTDFIMNGNWQIESFSPVNPFPNTVNQITIQSCGELIVFNPANASFPNLNGLTIIGTKLSNFTATVQMPQLGTLQLSSNQISNFTGDISLCPSLVNLNLTQNYMSTFNPSQPLPPQLQQINLSNNQLTAFNPTHALPNSLRYLFITGNILESFSPSQPFPINLYWVELNGNRITTFNPTYTLPSSLRVLRLNGNRLASANGVLSKIQNGLEELNLGENLISSFAPEEPLPNGLLYLNVGNNQLTNFRPIYGLPSSLTYLFLYNNQLTTYESSLPINLIEFNISGNNQLSNISVSGALGDKMARFASAYTRLTVSNVNEILDRLALVAYSSSGSKYINLQWQNPPAAPTGSGLNSKTILQARGYSVYTD